MPSSKTGFITIVKISGFKENVQSVRLKTIFFQECTNAYVNNNTLYLFLAK